MYKVSVDDWVYGKINKGGPEVMMKSMQGSITSGRQNKLLPRELPAYKSGPDGPGQIIT
jgi:hypothetical protein